MRIKSLLTGLTGIVLGALAAGQAPPARPVTAAKPPATSPATSPVSPATHPLAGPTIYTATNLPPRLKITLDPKVMWTTLPSNVLGANSGPDGRVWLSLRATAGLLTIDGAKALIRREFSEPLPQASLFRPVLFEPGGRVWFVFVGGADGRYKSAAGSLMGYDGKSFLELPEPARQAFSTERGGMEKLGVSHCAYIDGMPFFATSSEIYHYDGHQWETQDIPGTRQSQMAPALNLYPEPDGKGLIATGDDPAQPIWRWREGAWTQFSTGIIKPLPGDTPNSLSMWHSQQYDRLIGVAPRQHGVWLLTAKDGLTFIPFDATEVALVKPISVADLVQQLNVPETREFATRELLARGNNAQSELRQALMSAPDAESKGRLEKILPDLPKNTLVPQAWKMGAYNVSLPTGVLALPNGATAFAAHRVLDAAGKQAVADPARPPASGYSLQAPGVVIEGPDGTMHVLQTMSLMLQTSRIAHPLPWDTTQTPAPLVVDKGAKIWTLALGWESGPTLLDVATEKVVGRVPLPGASWVTAVASDGTVFVRADRSLQSASNEIFAYNPAGKDTRRHVMPEKSAAAVSVGPFTADGCFWFLEHPKDSPTDLLPARFDGITIQRFPQARIHTTTTFQSYQYIPGQDGVLIKTAKLWTLVSQHACLQGNNLEELIAQNAPEFAAVFTRRPQATPGYKPTEIVADHAGNIWLLYPDQRQLKVFSGGTWIEAAPALRKAGNPRGGVLAIFPVGDSSKILAADMPPNPPDSAGATHVTFLLSVSGKQITAEPEPDIFNLQRVQQVVYSLANEPWIDTRTVKPDHVTSMDVCRITPDGPVDMLENAAGKCVDSNGGLWLQRTRYTPDAPPLAVYQNGKVIPAPELPFSIESTPLWPGPNGRLCAASLLGLHSVRVNNQAGSVNYTDAETLAFGGTPARTSICGVSSRGFVPVIAYRVINTPESPTLLFYPLEKP